MNLSTLLTRKVPHFTLITKQSIRLYATGYWNKDWKPGPYPQTESQRRAAAKKYGLIPEDYECYPDDGMGYGDYPKLPILSAESKDPHYNYDMDEFKRNYGEPLHVDADLYGEERWDRSRRFIIPVWQMTAIFLAGIGVFSFLMWTGQHFRICFVRMMPKQMPEKGKEHYTFEIIRD